MERIIQKPQLSKATTKRLSLYLRCLKGLEKNGVTRIKSSELSKMTQVGSATIRRDFSHFGELGRSGYGYDQKAMSFATAAETEQYMKEFVENGTV